MACKRAARRKSSIWCFLVILMLHLRGVESSRSRVMTGRASGRDHGWPSGGGSFFQVAKVGRDDTEMRWVGSGRRVADSWSECERRRRGKIAGEGDVEVKQKGKERIGLGENGTNETAKRRPQSEAEETTRGWTGGIGRALGRSAARVRERRPGRTQSAQFRRVATGKITPARAPGR
jgi:hypothetical protein